MKTSKLVTILLCAWAFSSSAQEMKTNSLTLHWGVGNLQRQDLNYSKFVHQDLSLFNIGITYEHSGKQFHRVLGRFGHYSSFLVGQYTYDADWDGPFETYQSDPHNFNIVDLNYTLGFRIVENEKIEVLLGGQARNLLNQGDYNYATTGIGYYNFSFGLDIWSRASYQFKERHGLGIELSLPIIAWVMKAPYLGQDSKFFHNSRSINVFKNLGNYITDGELQSAGQSYRVDIRLDYNYEISRKWSLVAGYNLHINTTNTPDIYRSVENLLMVGAQLKF